MRLASIWVGGALTLFAGAAAARSSDAGPAVIVAPVVLKRVDYEVPLGNSSLTSRIRQASPINVRGKALHAYTKWTVTWNYRWARTEEICRLTSFVIQASATITVPRLTPSHAGSTEIADPAAYGRLLVDHEFQHVDILRRGANEFASRIEVLNGLPRPCRSLAEEIRKIGDRSVKLIDAENQQLDLETRHGCLAGGCPQ